MMETADTAANMQTEERIAIKLNQGEWRWDHERRTGLK